ncbi:MAG: lysophospholipid acyltransferase family protein [Gammaproteobacteria bacterium]
MLKPGSRLDRGWRIVGTGLSFAVFGIGACVISLTVFPVLRLASPDPEVARRRIQRAMQLTFKLFTWMMVSLGLLTVEFRNPERLARQGRLIVANHPSLIDVVLIISAMPAVDCIVKQALYRNPFLRWPVLWAGYIPNTQPEQLVEECAEALRAGRSLLVFPEGTRTVPGQPLQFKRGAAQIALAAKCEIQPITITQTIPTLTKAEQWYQVAREPSHWVVSVDEPMRIDSFFELAPSLGARHLTQHLLDYYSRRLGAPATAV